MISLSELRAIAMTLPEVVEGPPVPTARRIAAFKVAGKSFVGVEKEGMTMTASLPALGATPLSEPNEITAGINKGGKALYLHDPDGVTLELLQPANKPAPVGEPSPADVPAKAAR